MKLDRKNNRLIQRSIAVLTIVLVLCIGFLSDWSAPTAHAAINKEINYQGKLTNASSVAVADGNYNVEFKLYTTLTGGSAVWTEDDLVINGQAVVLKGGLFSVMLGSTTPLTGVNFNQTLYLGVNIGGTASTLTPTYDGEMAPRKIIGAVPAAFVADTLQGFNSGEFFRSDAANATSSTSAYLSVTQTGSGDIADFIGPSSAATFTIQSAGNVGVGTSTPFAALSVTTPAQQSGLLPLFDVASTTNKTLFNILGNGNVGIGTTTPQWTFAVAGAAAFTDNVRSSYFTATNSAATSTFAGDIYFNVTGSTVTRYLATADTSGGSSANLTIKTGAANSNGGAINITTGSGQGGGAITLTTGNSGLNSIAGPNITLNPGTGNNAHNGYILLAPTTSSNVGVGTSSPFAALSVSTAAQQDGGLPLLSVASTTNATLFNVLGNGNVGIGTTTPWKTFSVNGSLSLTGGFFDSTASAGTNGMILQTTGSATKWVATSTLGLASQWTTSGSNIYYTTGAAGVGTTSPFATLSVSTTGQQSGTLPLFDIASTTNATLFNVLGNGNVGIGTTTPSAQLAITGDAGTGRDFAVADSANNEQFSILDSDSFLFNTPGTFKGNITVTNSHPQVLISGTGDIDPDLHLKLDGGDGTVSYDPTEGLVLYADVGAEITTASGPISLFPVGGGVSINDGGGSHCIEFQTSSNGSNDVQIGDPAACSNGAYVDISGALHATTYHSMNVGIGSSTPFASLSVSTTTTASPNLPLLAVASSTNATLFNVLGNGNVGIGTTSPWQALSVAGNLSLTGALYDSTASKGTNGMILQTTGSVTKWVATSTLGLGTQWTTAGTNIYYNTGNVGVGTTTPFAALSVSTTTQQSGLLPLFSVASTTNASLFTVLGNGNVAVGTSTPAAKLDVYGNFQLSGGNRTITTESSGTFGGSNGTNLTLVAGSGGQSTGGTIVMIGGQNSIGGNLSLSGGSGTGGGGSIAIIPQGGANAGNIVLSTNSGTAGGNILITTADQGGSTGTGNGSIDINPTGKGFLVLATSTAFVGVGTTTPFSKFSVSAASSAATTSLFAVASSTNATLFNVLGNGNVGIGTTTPFSNLSVANIAQESGLLPLFTVASTTNTSLFTVLGNGNVGINTATPGANLTVNQLGTGSASSKGLVFSGTSIDGTNTGTGFMFSLGHNASGNKQIWFGDPDGAGNASYTFARFVSNGSGSIPTIDAVTGDGSARAKLQLGVSGDTNSGVYVGELLGVNGYEAIGSSFYTDTPPANGLIVQSNTGIGTSSPFATLSVSTTGQQSGTLPLFDIASTTNANLFNVLGNGNVGVGTTTPWKTLSVTGDLALTGSLYKSASVVGTPQTISLNLNNGPSVGFPAADFNFPSGGVYRVGEVSVAGTNDVFFQALPATTAGYGYFETYNGAGTIIGTGNATPIIFRPNRTEAMRLTSGGNLGIGTTTPGSQLSVSTTAQQSGLLPLFDVASTTNATLFNILGNGNVGVGTTTPWQSLSIAGNLSLTGGLFDSTASEGTNGMVLQSTGSATKWVATSTLGISGGSSQWTTTGTNITYTGGKVGVGTSTPFATLSVSTTTQNSGALPLFAVASTTNASLFTVSGVGVTTVSRPISANNDRVLSVQENGNEIFGVGQYDASSNPGFYFDGPDGGSSPYVRLFAGPSSLGTFDFIAGNVYFDGSSGILFRGTGPQVQEQGTAVSTATQASSLPYEMRDSVWTGSAAANHIAQIYLAASTAMNLQDRLAFNLNRSSAGGGSSYEALSLTYDGVSSGNVGIASTSPFAKLSVSNNTQQSGLLPLLTVASTTNANLFTVLGNGHVGVGTSTPWQSLSIAGNLSLTGGLFDSTASEGTNGMVLQSTGSATKWVATSTLGISGGSSQWTTTGTNITYTGGKVGVGTSTPFAAFSVSTTTQQSAALPLFTVASTTNANLFTVLGNGNVGINKESPAVALDVVGSANFTGSMSSNGATIGSTLNANAANFNATLSALGGLYARDAVAGCGAIETVNDGNEGVELGDFEDCNTGAQMYIDPGDGQVITSNMQLIVGGDDGSGADFIVNGGDQKSSFHGDLVVSGNVGIGTISPSYNLSLNGQAPQTIAMERETTSSTAGNSLLVAAGGAKSGGSNLNGGNLILQSGTSTGSGGSEIDFYTPGLGTAGTSDSAPFRRAAIYGNPRAGLIDFEILDPDTNGIFQVEGSDSSNNAYININSVTVDQVISGIAYYGSGSSGTYLGSNAHPVGVGVSPNSSIAHLFVESPSTSENSMVIRDIGSQTADLQEWQGSGGAVLDTVTAGGNIGVGTSTPFSTLSVSTTGQQSGSLPLFSVASTTNANLFTVLGNGHVGVGTSSPASTFTVVGSACISQGSGASHPCSTTAGTISADNFNTLSTVDLAENYHASDLSIKAGDIVAIDPNNDTSIVKAAPGLSIIGIISTDPGFLLGADSDPALRPVALSGRVPVEFSSENGSVKPGDNLTLSLTEPGVAAKAKPGDPVIGTVLSASSTPGTVLAFVRPVSSDFSVNPIDLSSLDTTGPGILSDLLSGVQSWMNQEVTATVGFFKDIFADKVTTNTLCLNNVCITQSQLQTLLQQAQINASNSSNSGSGSSTGGNDTSTTTPPTGNGGVTSTTTPPTDGGDTGTSTPPDSGGGSSTGGSGGDSGGSPPTDPSAPSDPTAPTAPTPSPTLPDPTDGGTVVSAPPATPPATPDPSTPAPTDSGSSDSASSSQ